MGKEYSVKYKTENYTCKSIEKTDFFIIKEKNIYFLSANDKKWKLKRFNVETEFMEDYLLEFDKKDWFNNEYKIFRMGEYLSNIYLIFYMDEGDTVDVTHINLKTKKIKNVVFGIRESIFWNIKII